MTPYIKTLASVAKVIASYEELSLSAKIVCRNPVPSLNVMNISDSVNMEIKIK